ncbi:MAG: hypothetical protein OWQ48_05630 [Desulfurococcus sp.]|nr:hypothetical protein [Desulfurococcus sp.]
MEHEGQDTRILVGFIREDVVRADNIVVNGEFSIGLAVGDVIIVNGRGRIKLASGRECIITSEGGPIFIEALYCGVAVVVGGPHPVVVKYLKAGKTYTFKAIIRRLVSGEWVSSTQSSVGRASVNTVVFMDPHVYIIEVENLDRVVYGYEEPGVESSKYS